MVENGLESLHFFHINVNMYFNLVTRFMNSCDSEGRYMDYKLETELEFQGQRRYQRVLNRCFTNLKNKNWLFYCKDLCSQFTPGRIDEFFIP